MVNFTQYSLGPQDLTAAQITSKTLQLAVPDTTNAAQWSAIETATQYAQGSGIKVIITVSR